MTSDTIQRMEAECTFWWQPPLWWDQQPMWMSVPPRWLNDVEVRDDSALLQLSERGVNPFAAPDAAAAGAAAPAAAAAPGGAEPAEAAQHVAAAAAADPEERAAAPGLSAEEEQEARAVQAELAETHRQLSVQQQMLTLDHHLVWKLKGLLGRLEEG